MVELDGLERRAAGGGADGRRTPPDRPGARSRPARDALRRADGDRLLAVIHHIAVDGWSLRLLLDDFRTLYRAERGGAPADLPPAAAPYSAFVDWQADLLAGPDGRPPGGVLAWPIDGRPARAGAAGRSGAAGAGDRRPRPGPAHPPSGVDREGAGAGARRGRDPYTVLLTALQVLLHRYTGQDDIAIGSPTAGRPQARFRRTVGYFVNPVVMRADLAGTPTFRHLLGRTRAAVSEALTHQHYPLSLLVELLRPAGARGGWSLVQVTFNHQEGRLPRAAGRCLPASRRAPPADGSRGQVELVSRSGRPARSS